MKWVNHFTASKWRLLTRWSGLITSPRRNEGFWRVEVVSPPSRRVEICVLTRRGGQTVSTHQNSDIFYATRWENHLVASVHSFRHNEISSLCRKLYFIIDYWINKYNTTIPVTRAIRVWVWWVRVRVAGQTPVGYPCHCLIVNLDSGNFVVNTKAISEFMIILSVPHIAKIR